MYLLEEGLRGLSRDSGDAHVGDLVRRARGIEEAEGTKSGGNAGEVVGEALHRVGSTEEQEEVEK